MSRCELGHCGVIGASKSRKEESGSELQRSNYMEGKKNREGKEKEREGKGDPLDVVRKYLFSS